MSTATQGGNGKAPLLEVDHVSKYFGNVIALKDVSATVDEGEVTCCLLYTSPSPRDRS